MATWTMHANGRGVARFGTRGRIALGAVCLCLAGAPAALASPPVYVANQLGDSVSQFDSTFGALSPLSPATVTLPATEAPSDVAVSPDGRSVYVTSNADYEFQGDDESFTASDLYQYSVGADGTLTPKTPPTVLSGPRAKAVVVTPDGGHVYVVSDYGVAQYAADATGALSPLTPRIVGVVGGVVIDLAVSGDGDSLYVTSSEPDAPVDDTFLERFAIGADGSLTHEETTFESDGHSIGSVAVSPDGQHGYYIQTQGLWRFAVGDLADKLYLAFVGLASDLVVRPGGDALYVSTADGKILQFAVAGDGSVTPMSPAVVDLGNSSGISVAVSPDGRSLYGVRFSIDRVAQFAIAADGTLSPRAPASVVTGDGPSAVAVGPDPAGARPSVSIVSPADGATFAEGAVVPSQFSCREGFGGPGNATCVDQDGRPSGAAVDTSTPGAHTFTATATSLNGQSSSRTVSYTVLAGNHPPVAEDQTVTAVEDVNKAITLAASDPDGGALSFTTTQPSHGGVSCTTDTACTYDPDSNYHGPDSFEFTVTDDHGATDTATVSINVTAVNDRPNVDDASATTGEDTSVDVHLTATDVDGDTLTATVTSDPLHGTATCAALECTYEPDDDFHGQDSFVATVSDGHGGSDTATVLITVTPVNDAPVAEDQSVSVFEDAGVTFTLGATDADHDSLSFNAAQPAHGTLTCTGAGCEYHPHANYSGSDSFTFTVSDGHGGTDSGRVDITVGPVNDAPAAEDRSVTVAEDASVTFAITATDADGDTLSTTVLSAAGHGSASCSGLSCTYSPAGNYNGPDSFTVTVSDTNGASDSATVSVSVTPVNDAPTAQNVTVVTDEDTTVQLALLGADIDGDSLSYAITGSGPQHGTVSCATALCTYSPAADYFGSDGFTYRATDASGASATATVSITVTSVADATRLTVPPTIRILSRPLLKLTIPFEARLTRATGQPLPGKTITFVTGGQPRCSATTNADGVARCSPTLNSLLVLIIGLRYTAVFDGDTTFAGSSGTGALIG